MHKIKENGIYKYKYKYKNTNIWNLNITSDSLNHVLPNMEIWNLDLCAALATRSASGSRRTGGRFPMFAAL